MGTSFKEFSETMLKLRRDSTQLKSLNVSETLEIRFNETDYIIFDASKNSWILYIDNSSIADKWNPTISEMKEFFDKYDELVIRQAIDMFKSQSDLAFENINAESLFSKFKEILVIITEFSIVIHVAGVYDVWYNMYEKTYYWREINSNDANVLNDDALKNMLKVVSYKGVHDSLNNTLRDLKTKR